MTNDNSNKYPLTHTQQDIYFDQLRHQKLPINNVGGYIKFQNIDVNIIKKAHEKLVQSIDVFGLRIVREGSKLLQYISNERNVTLDIIDFSHEIATQEKESRWLSELFIQASNEIENTELFQAYLIKLSESEYHYVGFAHHIIMDGWGFANWAAKIGMYYNLYSGLTLSKQQCLTQPTWEEVVIRNVEYENSAIYVKNKEFWEQEVASFPSNFLSLNYASTHKGAASSKRYVASVPQQLQTAMLKLSKELSTSLPQIYISALSLYFSTVYQQDSIVFGTLSHNRRTRTEKDMIGVFLSVSPLNIQVDKEKTFEELVHYVGHRQKQIFRHQRYPLGHIIRSSLSQNRTGIYDIGFNYLKLNSDIKMDGHVAELKYISHQHEQTPMMFTVWEYGDTGRVELQIDYNLSYFKKPEVELFTHRLHYILEQLCANPKNQVQDLIVLPSTETKKIASLANGDVLLGEYLDLPMHRNFERQVNITPDKVAVLDGHRSLTYKELNEQANKLAHYLSTRDDVGPSKAVGVCVERGVNMMVTLLAILKAGSAYLPLDPNYPASRLNFIARDAALETVITSSEIEACLSFEAVEILALDSDEIQETISREETSNLSLENSCLNDPAYIIHTSGSTGVPKGVVVSHKSVSNFLNSMADKPGMDATDTLLAVTSISFDIHVLELFLPLIVGGKVFIANTEMTKNPHELAKVIEEHAISIMQATPATWKMLLNEGWTPANKLKVLCGGEALSSHVAEQILEKGNTALWNMYGPTESTVWSCIKEIKAGENINIGRPIANTSVYVLDDSLNLRPIGISGELYIGGGGLAKGYLNRPELTHERFIKNPYYDESHVCSSERLYKTGDVVRYQENGMLEYLGRSDSQIKVRGFRIELGEIEEIITKFDGIKDAVVTMQDGLEGESNLIGYVVREDKGQQWREELITHLSETLPEYMIPRIFLELEELPLTANGKIDRKSLPKAEQCEEKQKYVAPQTNIEQQLCAIWEDVLGVGRVGLNDNFFALGGHSLAVVQMSSKLEEQYGHCISLKSVFQYPTVGQLATLLGKKNGKIELIAEVNRKQESFPLSKAQQRLWFLQQLNSQSTEYYINALYEISGTLDTNKASAALNYLIERHEVLRTNFVQIEGEPRQVIGEPPKQPPFYFEDLSSEDITFEQVKVRLTSHTFDLEKSPLIKMIYVKMPSHARVSDLLFCSMHHLISDGLSLRIFAEEFSKQYQQIELNNFSPNNEPLTVQYIDYVEWQKVQLSDKRLTNGAKYWQQLMEGAPSNHNLAVDTIQELQNQAVKEHQHHIDVGTLDKISGILKQHHVTLFMFFQTSFAVHIGRLSNEFDIVLGGPVATRPHAQLARIIGLFLNTQLYRTEFSDNPSFITLLQRMKEQHLASESYNDIPFEHLVNVLNPSRNSGKSPLFQILINYNSEAVHEIELGQCCLIPLDHLSINTNKYDITLYIDHNPDTKGLTLTWQFDSQLFSLYRIKQFASEYEYFLKQLICSPEEPVLSHGWKGAEFYSQKEIIAEDFDNYQPLTLFESICEKNPYSPALTYGDVSLDYHSTNQKVNKVANYLRQKGMGKGSRIAIGCERNLDRIIAIFAVIKIGGTYIPLSSEVPTRRIKLMIDAARPDGIIADKGSELLSELIDLGLVIEHFLFDEETIACCSSIFYAVSISFEQEAHILFTSGSTGVPKGVVGNYGSTFNRIEWMLEALPYQEGERVIHITSMAFVRSVWELLVPLCGGAHLILCDRNTVKQPRVLSNFLVENKINRIVTAPTLMKELISETETPENLALTHWFVSGEPLMQEQANKVIETLPHVQLYNLYGSTEVMSDVLYQRVKCTNIGLPYVPVGTAIKNVKSIILDSCDNPVPDGILGEIAIAGSALANGYLEEEDGSPSFTTLPVGNVYKTGDLGRKLPNGQIYCVGRKNDQIKIRGYRVELGEIIANLLAIPQVADATVSTHDSPKGKIVVAYLVADDRAESADRLDSSFILNKLKLVLSDYMLPSAIIWMDALPLRPNGKVNKHALPSYESYMLKTRIAPDGYWEEMLTELWADVLQIEKSSVCIEKNFFELGGNSLIITQVIERIKHKWSLQLNYRDFYFDSSIRALAKHLETFSLAEKVVDTNEQAKNLLVI